MKCHATRKQGLLATRMMPHAARKQGLQIRSVAVIGFYRTKRVQTTSTLVCWWFDSSRWVGEPLGLSLAPKFNWIQFKG